MVSLPEFHSAILLTDKFSILFSNNYKDIYKMKTSSK